MEDGVKRFAGTHQERFEGQWKVEKAIAWQQTSFVTWMNVLLTFYFKTFHFDSIFIHIGMSMFHQAPKLPASMNKTFGITAVTK